MPVLSGRLALPEFGFRVFRPPLGAMVQADRGYPTQISAWGGIAAFMEKLRAFLVRGEQRVIGGAMIVGPETSGTWPLKVEQDRRIWAGTPVRPYKCSIVFIANCVMGRGLSKGFMIELITLNYMQDQHSAFWKGLQCLKS